MGRSGSGKSLFEKSMVELYPERYKKVVSVTTRGYKRENEVEGRDYYFISNEEFQRRKDNDELVQTTFFADVNYGSSIKEYFNFFERMTLKLLSTFAPQEIPQWIKSHNYGKENVVLVITPKQAKKLKERFEKEYPGLDIIIVHYDISEKRLRENMASRGDTPEKIEERLSKDKLGEEFIESGLKADFTVTDNMLDSKLFPRFDSWIKKREV